MQSNGDESTEKQAALTAMMSEVPKNLKKIAGKSLPIEVRFINYKRLEKLTDYFTEIRVPESKEIRISESAVDSASHRAFILLWHSKRR